MPRRLTIVTYNIHSCFGTDRRLDPRRIADTIAMTGADIIALQEVDVERLRSGGLDQSRIIAEHLRMQAHFHPALHVENERYGDALLTAFPTRLIKAGPLPARGEARGALWVEVDVGGGQVLQVINTHLGLRGSDRMKQVETLLGPDWIGPAHRAEGPLILAGDFNSPPRSAPYRALAARLTDLPRAVHARPDATFPARFPLLRIDHIFGSKGIRTVAAEVIKRPPARRASDHLPLSVTIELETAQRSA
ncbi:Metal-dependent hydrolase, endonuclease/exonuclease/phosphatase family [Rhizobium sp. RU20A]|uniref:endonuclease/exonuclease/phosphatase family protein n=1 Tax=Rhizobium sp. RU20A TaxID=1907412 RepID=UPI000955A217|nr:endonuclease/exonuclease/phosphatase family protein [Rhizobium sp. RU20A]SIQ96919.1 Metal-dependent hydrolase, endonuclease/exonuclease/phosphatase family [Rhizobium sp. RU20A]